MPPLRYGHSEGHTDVCYSESNDYIITCGSEGDVRVWNGFEDTDQKDICVGEQAWAVCHKGNSLYVGTDTNIVQAYTFPDLDVDGVITRFKAPVTQIDVSHNGKKLAAGACDMEIHLVDLESMESKILFGHRAPILSVSFDFQSQYLASSSCDGTVRVWSLPQGDEVKQWDCLEKSSSFETSKAVFRVHFQPNGRLLAIPSNKTIKLYEVESWNTMHSLSADSNDFLFSVTRFSPCGKLIAGGTVHGHIYIWEIGKEKSVCQHSESVGPAITAIAWSPGSKSIVFCNYSGQLGHLEIPLTIPQTAVNDFDEDAGGIPLSVPEFDDDEDDENVVSLEKIKMETGFSSKSQNVNDDDDKSSSVSSFEKREPQIPLTELQEVFQPSSTPAHLMQRFMLWNSVGIVRQFNSDEAEEIDVEFHDTSEHHCFRLSNLPGYTMAALSNQVLVLASPRRSTQESKLNCILLKAWDGQKEWDANMGEDEIICIATGYNWVAAATEKNILKIFSIDGTQSDVISIPGPLVTMSGQESYITLYFHSAQGCDDVQFISTSKYFINPLTKLSSHKCTLPVALTPKATIKWVGFSDEGSPATVDSEGVLRLLYDSFWRPVCMLEERSKGKYDHYFVVGVNEKTNSIRCILCKGGFYPPVIPKPLLTEVEWKMPLCEVDTEKGALEEEMLRKIITLPNLDVSKNNDELEGAKQMIEKSISVTVMKLFALACKSGLEGRAVSLCQSMPSVEVVNLASKYAAKLGRHQLANRISDIAYNMSRKPKVIEVKDDEESVNSAIKDDSQDIFDSSDTVQKNQVLKDKDNMILKMRRRKQAHSSTDAQQNNLPSNPFKKASTNHVPDKESDLKENGMEQKVSFVDWFHENKSQLKKDYPLLNDSELAITGMKRYRQQNASSKTISQSDTDDIIENTPQNDTGINKLKKRTNFEFKKNLENDEVIDKKRKIPAESGNLKKKPAVSAAAKLKSFSFTKKS